MYVQCTHLAADEIYSRNYTNILFIKNISEKMGQLSSRLPGADKNARRDALKTFKGKVQCSLVSTAF